MYSSSQRSTNYNFQFSVHSVLKMEGDEEVVLLGSWASSFGMRVRLALGLKGIKHEYKEENLMNKSHLLQEMNRVHKKIPVLIYNGNPICESLIIVEYVDQVWNDRFPLLPLDAYGRSQARFWADFVDNKICSLGKRLWKEKGEEQEKAKNELIEHLKTMEGGLGDKPYFSGDNIGFVDVALLPLSTWFCSFEKCANFSIKDECPKIVAWVERCMEMETVSKSLPHPHTIHGFVLQVKEMFGYLNNLAHKRSLTQQIKLLNSWMKRPAVSGVCNLIISLVVD